MRIYGYVLDSDNRGIEFANVVVMDSIQKGTTTNKNGYYELLIPLQDTLQLAFSMVGYTTVYQRIIDPKDVIQVNIEMTTSEEWLEEVQVRGIKRQQTMMDQVDAQTSRIMPDATGGSIESLLITFAGVNQNNELSSQYNVRGGSFDENVVYVNGIEVHRPLLIRSGQQEGLSFVNPYMADNVSFSAGGYDAQYGDKMSSVLDISYKRPSRFEASFNASLLGANLYIGHGNERFSQMHGIRYKTSQYMLGSLASTGNYQPNFFDYQTYLTWSVGKPSTNSHTPQATTSTTSCAKPWQISFLGNISVNDYIFQPDSMSESWGGLDAKNLTIWYEGQEKDRFITAFGALSAKGQVGRGVQIGWDLSGFYTHERENYDITGEYVLSNKNLDASSSSSGSTRPGEMIDTNNKNDVLGTGKYHQHARNRLEAGVFTISHRGDWKEGNNDLSWGLSAQIEHISDHISEWEWRDSAGYSIPNNGQDMALYYTLKGDSAMLTTRLQAYVQNTHKWQTDAGQVILTVGGRLQWWSWTREILPSPRASLVYIPGWKRDFSLRFATGLYYQAPFYKELRDTITGADGVTRIALTDQLKAQRSVHVVLGGDYYFRAWGRPFKLTAEGYYKYIDRMETYTVDNVRVRYSGKNDAKGYAAGLDMKLYGELAPGADSWISLSFMRARHQLLDQPDLGWIPSPQEQRYSFSMLLQDYLPQLPQLRAHLKMIWSDGMPFSAPRNYSSMKQLRMSDYRRVDLGITYLFNEKTTHFMRSPKAAHIKEWSIQFEVFNLVGWKNVNSYFWVSDAYSQQWASPNYLTGRRYNLKIQIDLQ